MKKPSQTAQLYRWLPAIVMMTIIFLVASVPGKVINSSGLGKEVYHINGHFLMFFVLCFAYYKAVKNVSLSLAMTFFYALTDEFHQKFVSMRSSSINDLLVDFTAAIVAAIILWKLQHIPSKKLKNWLKK